MPIKSNPWDAEFSLGAELAATLVAGQFPAFAGVVPRLIGAGFCNQVWAFGEVAFRFPRRDAGVRGLAVERRVLPVVAEVVPAAVPVYEYFGEPSAGYPAPFVGYRLLPGQGAVIAAPPDSVRERLAPQLGTFLRRLHALDPAATGLDLPDGAWRCDLVRRVEGSLGRLDTLIAGPRPPALRDVDLDAWRRGLQADPPPASSGEGRFLHGDFYARHLILDAAGDLAGVIDWEDACRGDPAQDLAVAYSFLPPGRAREAFFEAYGVVDAATRARAARFAETYRADLAAYAADVGDGPLLREVARMAPGFCRSGEG